MKKSELKQLYLFLFNVTIGKVEPWEWNIKNLTRLVLMLNESLQINPSAKIRFSKTQWLPQTDSNDSVFLSVQDRLVNSSIFI